MSPEPIEEPMYRKLGLPAEVIQGFASRSSRYIPLKRCGEPEEIARAALFLASDDASFMTGEDIVVEGSVTRV